MDQSGVGDVRIKKGTIGLLTLDLSGVGSFIFNGRVDEGSFDLSGVGDIKVDECGRVVRREVDGVGDLRIGTIFSRG